MTETNDPRLFELIRGWFESLGLEGLLLTSLSWIAVVVGVFLLAVIANLMTKRILLTSLKYVIKRTKTKWDDALLERNVLQRAAHVAPALIFYWLAGSFPGFENIIQRLAQVYMVVIGALVVNAFLNAVVDVYRTLDVAKDRPIKGYIQIVQIIAFVLLAVLGIAVMFDQSPFGLLGGLGAMTAVLILVFKDTILGLVASFQISSSNMVRIGDWIEMPQYGADGDVIDITLHTIKVQNWNKTISTIPTYSLISGSFKNWRGMSESGGRRIKRAINIDMNSIRFCTDEMLERFSGYQFIAEYIERKKTEVQKYNTEHNVGASSEVNGRRMTNIGTFRAYVEAYLHNHPKIHKEMTFLVRHLPPGEHGLPLEIYVFSNDQVWANYEAIQADIFDHLLAVLPKFDLRVFQNPTGYDFRGFGDGNSAQGSN